VSKIDTLRKIVEDHQAAKVDGTFVDAFSASAIVKVYDALNDQNKAKFASLPVWRMADITWKLLEKQNA